MANFIHAHNYEVFLTRKPAAWETKLNLDALQVVHYNQPVNLHHVVAFSPVRENFVFRDETGTSSGMAKFPAICFQIVSGDPIYWFYFDDSSRDDAVEKLLDSLVTTVI
jgi:hypothetical protein